MYSALFWGKKQFYIKDSKMRLAREHNFYCIYVEGCTLSIRAPPASHVIYRALFGKHFTFSHFMDL